MQIVHTSYIKTLADKTGRTYRDLESLWKRFEREVEYERMFNPNMFSHMRKIDGSIAQEIARRFEKFLINPISRESESLKDNLDELEDTMLAQEIENKIEEVVE